MYLLVIHVPFRRIRPNVVEVATDWGRSLLLLRDSLKGRCGPIVVASPEYPPGEPWPEQVPVEIDTDRERIDFVPLCKAGLRAREFWPQARRIFKTCRRLADGAVVVHCGMSDLFRPIPLLGFIAARRARRPTVFFEDTDVVTQLRQLAGRKNPIRTHLYAWAFSRVMRYMVARADLAFLKGKLLMDRYARFARNPRDFLDTSHSLDWVITGDQLKAKLAELTSAGTLKCLSLGRLVARKGIDHSIQVIEYLNRMGVPATLDIIGTGPERSALESEMHRRKLDASIRFLDAVPYGPEMIAGLQRYHLMLFTPLAEDTPRSLFDALAAGVPVAGYAIDFVRDVISAGSCGIMGPLADPSQLAREIQGLWADRGRLAQLVRNAADAGRREAAECWYQRRADWTFEIFAAKTPQYRPECCRA